ncbi:MAG TPA: hypothetical protein VM238_17755 [Phycisphaerae bacterium]|nr:hypothetical protein [Phycisphaerae bacterium]
MMTTGKFHPLEISGAMSWIYVPGQRDVLSDKAVVILSFRGKQLQDACLGVLSDIWDP